MKKNILAIVVILFSYSVAFSQSVNNGRSADARPSAITSEVKTIQSAQDTAKVSSSDKDIPKLTKSAESTAGQVIAEDLIVQGSLGIGSDMNSDYNFGFNTFVLKENNLRILFDDTSASGGFPGNDWLLKANDTEPGGANYFAIQDATAGRDVFKIEAGAPANSFYVQHSGKVGIGTATPFLELHVKDFDTPGLRLEQDNTGGWAPQTWDICGNETNFFIRDVTNSSMLPFRIQSGTPTSTLTLKSNGNVGIGTWSPLATFHVSKTGEAAAIRLERTDVSAWDMVSDTTFSIRNNYGGETLPVQIQAGAPSNSFYINNVGYSGIGKNNPQAKLHVAGSIKVDSVIYYNPIDTAGVEKLEGTMIMDSVTHRMKYFSGNKWISMDGNQNLILNNDTLYISGSDSVINLAPYLDNTDNQALSLSNNVLSIEGANSVDLSVYKNTDRQVLSIYNNILRISGASSPINLSRYLDNTDKQELSLSGSILSISGSDSSVDLSDVVEDTDDQTLSLDSSILSIVGGNSVDLSGAFEDDQTLSLNGTTLSITDGNSVDLSEIMNNTDEQTLVLNGTMLSISSGNSVDLSELVSDQQSQIADLIEQVETLTNELAELKGMVATLVGTTEMPANLNSSSIDQNIPNPFSTTTVIPYNIAANVKNAYIGFYSPTGQLIETVQIEKRGSGSYTFVPDNTSKIYLYTLFVDGVKVETRKMIITE